MNAIICERPDRPLGYPWQWECPDCLDDDDGRIFRGHCLTQESAAAGARFHDAIWHKPKGIAVGKMVTLKMDSDFPIHGLVVDDRRSNGTEGMWRVRIGDSTEIVMNEADILPR